MIRNIFLLIISLFFFIGWNCGDHDTISDPITESRTLFTCYFETNEENGGSWNYADSTAKNYVSISRDVAPWTGSQSLKLQRDTVTGYIPAIFIRVINSYPHSNKKYSVNYYSKGRGEILIEINSSSELRTAKIGIDNLSWQRFFKETLFCGAKPETLKITFKPLANDSISYLFIDNVNISD
ncbi:MAG: hypothetical protein WC727_12620 [Ignavibacteriaceae bacterium]